MVFCNLLWYIGIHDATIGHNPYFNRWFSAILVYGYSQKP